MKDWLYNVYKYLFFTNRIDRNNNILNIGDKVRYITGHSEIYFVKDIIFNSIWLCNREGRVVSCEKSRFLEKID